MASENGRKKGTNVTPTDDFDVNFLDGARDPARQDHGTPDAASGEAAPPLGRTGISDHLPDVSEARIDPYAAVKSELLRVREPWGAVDDPARAKFRNLMPFLTDKELPGGKLREVPRITLEATPRGYKATMTDYLLSMKLVVEFLHIEQIFDALEAGFRNPKALWVEVKSGEGYKLRKEEERKRLAAQSDELYNAAKGGGRRPLGDQ